MAVSKAQTGLGTVFSIGGPTGGSGSENFAAVGEVTDLPFEMPETKTQDATSLGSSIERSVPTIPGLTSITVMGIRGQNDAGQIAVEAAYVARVPYDFKVQLPPNAAAGQTTTGDLVTFSAYVLSSKFPIKPTEIIKFEIKIQYDSLPVLVLGS